MFYIFLLHPEGYATLDFVNHAKADYPASASRLSLHLGTMQLITVIFY